MKVAVIGGAGFIGSTLSKRLVREGHSVVVYDNFSTGSPNNFNGFTPKPTVRKFDISMHTEWRKFGQADVIFSLACFPRSVSMNEPLRDLKTNYFGTLYGLQTAEKQGAVFIFASNTGIVSNPDRVPVDESFTDWPTTPYDNHKLASEHLIRIYSVYKGVRGLVFRFASVYGPNQRCHEHLGWHPIVPHFITLMSKGIAPNIDGSGEQTRDFIYVDDIVNGLVLGMQKLTSRDYGQVNGQKIILGTNTETSINTLYSTIANSLGFRHQATHGPERVADIHRMKYDHAKASRLLGWHPNVTLHKGIALTMKSMVKD